MKETIIIRVTVITIVILFALMGLIELDLISNSIMKTCLLVIGLMYITVVYRVTSKENSVEERGH